VAGDNVGIMGVLALTNGNHVVKSPIWRNEGYTGSGRADVFGLFPETFSFDPTGTATLAPSALSGSLNTGTAVTLQANNDITINSAITVNNPSGNGGALTMQAGRSILINANITTDNGALTLSANDPGASASYRDAGTANITMAAGTSINTGTGALTAKLNGSGGTITFRDITAGDVDAQGAVQNLGTTTLTTLAMSGGDLTLGAGGSMVVAGLANIAAGNTLNLTGGSFTSGSLGISGSLNLNSGSLSTGATTIANGGTFTLTGGTPTFTGPMTVQAGGTLNYGLAGATNIPGASSNAGTMNFTGGTVNFTGGLTQTAGTMTLNGGNASGNVALNGGTLGGSGTLTGNLDIGPSGILAVGFSPGSLNITGNLTLASTSTTNIEVGGLTAGSQFDQINVGGLATLGGTLNVTSWGGYTPVAGNTFDFLTFGSSAGAFATTNLPAAWGSTLSPLATYLQLAIPAAALPPATVTPPSGSLITIAPDVLPTNDTQLAFEKVMVLADAAGVSMLAMPQLNDQEEPRQCR
jgi:hypothetical protein